MKMIIIFFWRNSRLSS